MMSHVWRSGSRATLAWVVIAAVTCTLTSADAQDAYESTVGFPARLDEIVLPGSELEVIPADIKPPMVLRIDATRPHGTAFRYDLVYYGLEPGTYDLRDSLRRKNGGDTSDLPPIEVTIASVLPDGQILPNRLRPGKSPRFGSYEKLMIGAAVAWGAILLILLFVRRPNRGQVGGDSAPPPRTLADRLRPLVERALSGDLTPRERSDLELNLVSYWRRRLDLDGVSTSEAVIQLRQHDEAGPLLRGLEEWLHNPTPPTTVDVSTLLAPYQELPSDLFEQQRVGG